MSEDPVSSTALSGASNYPQRSQSLSQPQSQSQLQQSSSSSHAIVNRALNSQRTSPFASNQIFPITATTLPNTTAPTLAPATSAPMATSAAYSMASFQFSAPAQASRLPAFSQMDFEHDAPGFSLHDSVINMGGVWGEPVVIIRGLEPNSTIDDVKKMCTFAMDQVSTIDIEQPKQDDEAKNPSAIVRFKSQGGAALVKNGLHGKNGLIVEYQTARGSGPSSGAGPSNATSPGSSSMRASGFDGAFSSLGKVSPPNTQNLISNGFEFANGRPGSGYPNIFSQQAPLGNHLNDQPRVSGKSLIKDAIDDDDTGDILKDPRAYAENGSLTLQRRATAPHLPSLPAQMSSLSLNTGSNGMSGSQRGPSGMYQPLSANSSTMSPTTLNGTTPFNNPIGPIGNYSVGGNAPWSQLALTPQRSNPPVNPADMNPPCNTLYVGNLPMGTSEDELKALFSRQRGYKRLCFRAKNGGPMCFVEFDDISFATKALYELYGTQLTNSVKGGIRLSFSKNPLGVRGPQQPGQGPAGPLGGQNAVMGQSANGFGAANGPPPGLSAPPGLSTNRPAASYSLSSMTNGSSITNGTASYTPSSMANGNNGIASYTPSSMANSTNGVASYTPSSMANSTNGIASYTPSSMANSTNGIASYTPSSMANSTNGIASYTPSSMASGNMANGINGTASYTPFSMVNGINGISSYTPSSMANGNMVNGNSYMTGNPLLAPSSGPSSRPMDMWATSGFYPSAMTPTNGVTSPSTGAPNGSNAYAPFGRQQQF